MWASASCISRSSMREAYASALREVFVEPGEHAAPGVGRRTGHVGVGADVAVEAVAGIAVADDLGVDRRILERSAELLDVFHGDRLVLVAEEAQPRPLQRLRLADERGE